MPDVEPGGPTDRVRRRCRSPAQFGSPYAVSALRRTVYFNDHRPLADALDFELACFISTGREPEKQLTADAFAADVERLGDSPFVVDIQPWLDGRD